MKSYNEKVINELSKIILEDKFDDKAQNGKLYDDFISMGDVFKDFFYRNYKKGSILDVGCGSGELFRSFTGLIGYGVDPNMERLDSTVDGISIKQGWCENIPFDSDFFNTVIVWGTFCFIRSPMEALYELSRVLTIGGVLILDVKGRTNLSISQTVEPKSFANWVKVFGFDLIERRVVDTGVEDRYIFSFEKIKDFNWKDFLLPQCVGEINNYNPNRDWYLK